MTAPLPGNRSTAPPGEHVSAAKSAGERGIFASHIATGSRRDVPEELVVGWSAGDRLFLAISLAFTGLLLGGHAWLNVQSSASPVRITANPIQPQLVASDGDVTPLTSQPQAKWSVTPDPVAQISTSTSPVLYRIDVNEADWVAWAQLDGIGETLARRIVEDRVANGPFPSVDDVQRVRGIGAKTLTKMRPHLFVEPPGAISPQNAEVPAESPVR